MGFDHIAVLGAGAWGTALANILARSGRSVALWAHNPALAAALRESRENARLPGIPIEDRIAITDQLADVSDADAILLAVPAQALRGVAITVAPGLREATPLIACAKGIERGTHKFMTEVIAEAAPKARAAILSGPSFAADVARGLPTAVTLAAADEALAAALAAALGSTSFRLYHSTDIRGVEIGGAAKNVLAIAAGIVAGRGLGSSASAALTTRGFAELFRFGNVFGARPETLVGLSGLGDLILTCSSPQSRNFTFGLALGRGSTPAQATGKLAEGIFTASVLVDMAQARAVEMPIATAVSAVLDGRLSIDQAIESLLTRPFRAEG
jgi:glycerol-3-phosphate dehydrogenase (NAD(P)+)